MASRVNICQVNILDNPAMFNDKIKLEIIFEVYEDLPHDIEWELVYVGSGTSSEYDQVLDSILVGPTPEGRHKFVFDAVSPDVSKIPVDDIVGVSVLLLRCKYNDQEFLNLGWFVTNEYTDDALKENPPATPVIEKLARKIETEDLRVTPFPIKWTEEESEYPPETEEEQLFAEEELMPVNDEGDEDDDEDDDEDEDGDIDLNESFDEANKRVSNALDAVSTDNNDVEMECESAGDEPNQKVQSSSASQDPLNDMTNSN